MSSDPVTTSDKIMICQSGLSLSCAAIDSGALGSWDDPGPQPLTLLTRAFDFAWDPSGSTGILVSEDGLANDYSSAIWTGTSWTGGQTVSANIGHLWVSAATNPFDNDSVNSIFVGSNALNELDYLTFDGSDLALQSGGLSLSHLGSALYEGASVDFRQDLSWIHSASVLDTLSVSESTSRGLAIQAGLAENLSILGVISRQLSTQNILNEIFTLIDVVLGTLGSGAGTSESIVISDTVSVTKSRDSNNAGGGGSGGGGGGRAAIIQDPHDREVPVVSAYPGGGQYASIQTVSLSANEPATIYYTLDGTSPTLSSKVYSSPITIASNVTLMYLAVDAAGNTGTISVLTYVINLSNAHSDANVTNATASPGTQNSGAGNDGGSGGEPNSSDGIDEQPENEQRDNLAIGEEQNDDGFMNEIPVGSEVSHVTPAYDGAFDVRNIAIVGMSIIPAAIAAPTILLHLSNRKEIFIDGVLIDGSSLRELGYNSDSGLLEKLAELQYDLSWTTGLRVDDIKIILDHNTACSLGIDTDGYEIGGDKESAQCKPPNIAHSSQGRIGDSVIIAKDSELLVEKIRNELEARIVLAGEKWFILGAEDYKYGKKKFEKLLTKMHAGEYRDHQEDALLEAFLHINLILESAGNPRFLMTDVGNILYNNRFVRNCKFKSRYGKASNTTRDEWIEGQLARFGIKLTNEGEKLMSYDEKYDLLRNERIRDLMTDNLKRKTQRTVALS